MKIHSLIVCTNMVVISLEFKREGNPEKSRRSLYSENCQILQQSSFEYKPVTLFNQSIFQVLISYFPGKHQSRKFDFG